MKLEDLQTIILQRKKANSPSESYVASLFAQGRDRIAQKVGEEAVEVVIAAVKKRGKSWLMNSLTFLCTYWY